MSDAPIRSTGEISARRFLHLATLFEGSLVLVAYVIGWLGGVDPWADLRFDALGWLYGLAATLPLFLASHACYRQAQSFEPMRQVKDFLIERMGPVLDGCRGHELVYLGLLAGVTEEVLFRGVIQPLMESGMGSWPGLIASNLLFALVHAVTPLYAVLAGLTGTYLGLSLDLGGERNLLIPILIHACYDMLAFRMVVRSYREARGRRF
ncbi:CPBP family intramembrane glutamic endopeptidase [Methylococcus sp. EFPC2]|uniref:CPBP family intramembrane glutamic endopeptidase n=1 Tax=Methylococcus sp. EFPC2 TaxID=2812648 RepID=UPI001967D7FB|nr:CPBP family intramembrane glutamic endopeptidase [Methylococcus sp. EFPC2]QSA98020.1 CPBP family intramembrane metalloprotease [Methylococcus sp. EFPC2]